MNLKFYIYLTVLLMSVLITPDAMRSEYKYGEGVIAPSPQASAITVPVVVANLKKNSCVANLKIEDFLVYEDEQLVPVSSFTLTPPAPLSVVLFGDVYVGGGDTPIFGTPGLGKDILTALQSLKEGDRFSLMIGDRQYRASPWSDWSIIRNETKDGLLQEVGKLMEKAGVGSDDKARREDLSACINYALLQIANQFNQPESIPSESVILYAKTSQSQPGGYCRDYPPDKVIPEVVNSKASLYWIGFGVNFLRGRGSIDLKEVSLLTGGKDIGPRQIKKQLPLLLTCLRSRYLLRYQSPKPVADGKSRKVRIELSPAVKGRKNYTLNYPRLYYPVIPGKKL